MAQTKLFRIRDKIQAVLEDEFFLKVKYLVRSDGTTAESYSVTTEDANLSQIRMRRLLLDLASQVAQALAPELDR